MRRNECVPCSLGFRPIIAAQPLTIRAYCLVDRCDEPGTLLGKRISVVVESRVTAPVLDGVTRLLCELKADGLLRLVLNDHGAGDGVVPVHHVANLEPNQIATP